jgi:hypothetical protein
MNVEEKAKKILQKILYITLATATKEGQPWNSPVYSRFDQHYNYFWGSAYTSRHSANIRANNKVGVVVYDSTAPAGTGVGIYMEGKAYELTDEKETTYGLNCLFQGVNVPLAEDFLGESPLRVYKFVPEKFWMNVDEDYKGQFVDKRQEVFLINDKEG